MVWDTKITKMYIVQFWSYLSYLLQKHQNINPDAQCMAYLPTYGLNSW